MAKNENIKPEFPEPAGGDNAKEQPVTEPDHTKIKGYTQAIEVNTKEEGWDQSDNLTDSAPGRSKSNRN